MLSAWPGRGLNDVTVFKCHARAYTYTTRGPWQQVAHALVVMDIGLRSRVNCTRLIVLKELSSLWLSIPIAVDRDFPVVIDSEICLYWQRLRCCSLKLLQYLPPSSYSYWVGHSSLRIENMPSSKDPVIDQLMVSHYTSCLDLPVSLFTS